MTSEILKDSVETLSNDVTKQLLNRTDKRRVRKGVASAHPTVPTIPSKYATLITDTNEKNGFRSTSKRFQYSYTDTPGPGSYSKGSSSIKLNSPSHSCKGYGPFASTASRSPKQFNPNNTPGAGAYETLRTDFNHHLANGPTAAFKQPIAVQSNINKENAPGPNSYDVSKAFRWIHKQNNVCADHAFKSNAAVMRSNSDSLKTTDHHLVAPNSYFVKDELLHSTVRVPFSSFKSNTKRNTFALTSTVPAPNEYHPYEPITEPIERQLFPRRHYLAISAPAVPLTPELPLPGPGAYNLRDFREPEKKYMSSSAFVSSSSRWFKDVASQNAQTLPGPAKYYPAKITKQSFHYNFDRKWV